MPWLRRFSISSISSASQPSTTFFTPSTLPSHDLKASSSFSCFLPLADSRSQAVLNLPSSKRRLSFSFSSYWILVLSKLMLWQLRSQLYFAASSCSSSTCTVALWSSMMRQNLRFSSSRCIIIASLLLSASLVSESSSAMSSRSLLSISISLSLFASSFWNSLMRLSSLFSLTFSSADSSSLRSITQARFFCSSPMSSMALSSAISSPWILRTEDSMMAFSLQSSQNLVLQSCIVKLRLWNYKRAVIQIRATSEFLPRGCLLRQLLAEHPAYNWQSFEKRRANAPTPLEEQRIGDAENGASDHLGQSVVDQLDPRKALGHAEHQPHHFLPRPGVAVPDLVEAVGHHHDHVGTGHSEAALARKLRPRIQLSLQIPWKARLSSLSPTRQAEASSRKTLKCERRLESGAASRQSAGMRQGSRLRQAQRMLASGLGQAPICLKGKAHYKQQGAGVMIIIYKVEGAPSFSGHALMHVCPNLVPRTQSHYPTAVRSHRPIVKNWLDTHHHINTDARPQLLNNEEPGRFCSTFLCSAWHIDGLGLQPHIILILNDQEPAQRSRQICQAACHPNTQIPLLHSARPASLLQLLRQEDGEQPGHFLGSGSEGVDCQAGRGGGGAGADEGFYFHNGPRAGSEGGQRRAVRAQLHLHQVRHEIDPFLHQARLPQGRGAGALRGLREHPPRGRQHRLVRGQAHQRGDHARGQGAQDTGSRSHQRVPAPGLRRGQGQAAGVMALLFLYNQFPQQSLMQVFATPADKQKRSMSYNDLKKKRLLHSQSHRKLAEQSTVKKKGMSEAKSILSTLPKDEKVIESCINELKGVLGSLREKSCKKRIISIRENLTERPSLKQSVDLEGGKLRPAWNNVEEAGETKQMIKQLLSKNKSQRRMVRFNEIRDKFKQEKERSLSNDHKSAIRPIPSPIKESKDKTLLQGSHGKEKDVYSRQTQPTLKMGSPAWLDAQLDSLERRDGETSRLWRQQLAGKQNRDSNAQSLEIADISSIGAKEGEKFNESELGLLQAGTHYEGSFLQLLNGEPGRRQPRSKELRRRGELERMRKIFPADFFGN